ncbi:hypothetical protein [Brucella pituitosa]
MKRRSFLRMLGLAPIVAASPSLALPKPDSPKRLAEGGLVNAGEPRLYGEAACQSAAFDSIRSSDGRLMIASDGTHSTIKIHVDSVKGWIL